MKSSNKENKVPDMLDISIESGPILQGTQNEFSFKAKSVIKPVEFPYDQISQKDN